MTWNNREDTAVLNYLRHLQTELRDTSAASLAITAAITGIDNYDHWTEDGEPAFDGGGNRV